MRGGWKRLSGDRDAACDFSEGVASSDVGRGMAGGGAAVGRSDAARGERDLRFGTEHTWMGEGEHSRGDINLIGRIVDCITFRPHVPVIQVLRQ